MEFKIKNSELIELDKEIFNVNKIYGMALRSLGNLPNTYATEEFIKISEGIVSRLKKIKTDDEFEKLLIENYLYNLEAQEIYLEYFTTGKKQSVDKLFSKIFGKEALGIIKQKAKDFDYKGFWEYYLSYQEYTYRQIPCDDESLRETFKNILKDLKEDVLDYANEHFNFPRDYSFDLILGQPYSSATYFQPTTKRMEISSDRFFVFKDGEEIKINVCSVIESLFHELIGHGRQQINSAGLPLTLQDNSINTAVPPLHIHSEGVAQRTRQDAIAFMNKYKEKYKIEEDYIRQIELSEVSDSAINILIFYQYLQFKNIEDDKVNIEKEFLELIKNRGLYILYSTGENSPLSCMKNSTYPIGLEYITNLLDELKKDLGNKKFEENHSLINQMISVGLWNFRVLPRFIKLCLKKQNLLN